MITMDDPRLNLLMFFPVESDCCVGQTPLHIPSIKQQFILNIKIISPCLWSAQEKTGLCLLTVKSDLLVNGLIETLGKLKISTKKYKETW